LRTVKAIYSSTVNDTSSIVTVPIERGMGWPPSIDAVDFISWLNFADLDYAKFVDLTSICVFVDGEEDGGSRPSYTFYSTLPHSAISQTFSARFPITFLFFKHDAGEGTFVTDVNVSDVPVVDDIVQEYAVFVMCFILI
jgi:hypothetical protein